MAEKGVEKRHSQTALFAALYRAIANKEFKNKGFASDYLAEYFLPYHFRFLINFKKIRSNIINKSSTLTPGIYEYMLARTAFFDSVFIDALNKNISQIVQLGAGYDTRAYRFERLNTATKIIEMDVATTQNRKKKCLQKAKINIPENVTLISIDFNKESLKNVLEQAGYDKNTKTLFIWEGVSYYLEPEAVDATLEFVKNSSHNKSIIAFDYAIGTTEETINHYYGAKKFAQTWKKHRSNELFKFAVNEGKIESFLVQRGLKIINHMDIEDIEKSFLLKDNGVLIGHINGLFRFVLASTGNQSQKGLRK